MDAIYLKALEDYGQWLREQIDKLAKLEGDPHESVSRFAASVVEEAGNRGLKLGLTGLYEATRVRSDMLDVVPAKLGLECCLAKACDPSKAVAFSVEEYVRQNLNWRKLSCRG